MLSRKAMQLIAGRTAQEYNERKNRRGAFWEDRYHASVIEVDEHLHRCLVYIDLNMVRAGAVSHPVDWEQSGYREIQKPPKRYAIIDLQSLSELSRFADVRDFKLHIANGSSKRLRVVVQCVTIAGRKRLGSGVWYLSRASRASSAAERCIAELSRKTEPMRCVHAMRLTTVISAAKVSP